MIQGAGSVYIWSEKLKGALGAWVCKLKDSGKKYGVIICAIASKLARICWRILRDRTVYHGVIICAIASKLARICWRILRDRTVYQPNWQAAHSV